jgi:hypothetical protein
MNINEYILKTFNPLLSKSKFTSTLSDSIAIKTTNGVFVEMTKNKILFVNKMNLLEKIKPRIMKTDILESQKIRAFLNEISPSFIRLNHVGVSYYSEDPIEEIKKYQDTIKETGLKIYQEQSESLYEKWYFIGDRKRYETPLCEIVLNSASNDWYKDWLPAFQIDIDTSLSMEELEKISEKHFGKNFWKWKLDIPDYGIVLAMAIIGEINGVKLTFGVGTNLRNIELQRKSMGELA